MFQSLDVFRTAIAMARHAGTQQALSAQNIANADTPDYRALEIPDVASTLRTEGSGMRATRDSHLHGGSAPGAADPETRREAEDPNGNTVSIELELVTATEAMRSHDRALAIYRSNLNLLRASLGR
jgi:flagellar basal-body rod protein FlgB